MDKYREKVACSKNGLDRLVPLLQNGLNDEAWDEFFSTFGPRIFRLARGAGLSVHDSEDVLQEAMRAVVREIPRFNHDPGLGGFTTWVNRIARSKIIDNHRKQARFKCGALTEPTEPSAASGTFTPFAEEALRRWDEESTAGAFDARYEAVVQAYYRIQEKISQETTVRFRLWITNGFNYGRTAKLRHASTNAIRLTISKVVRLLRAELEKTEGSEMLKTLRRGDTHNAQSLRVLVASTPSDLSAP